MVAAQSVLPTLMNRQAMTTAVVRVRRSSCGCDLGVDKQRRLAGRVDLIVVAADAGRAARRPAGADMDTVAGIALDQQLVRLVGDVEHVVDAQGQAVVAGAGEVDVLDTAGAVVGERREVKTEPGAVEAQRVGSRAAVDEVEIEARYADRVVARAAMKGVGPAAAA